MTYPPKKMEGPTAYRDPIAPYNRDYSIWSCACPHINHTKSRSPVLPAPESGLPGRMAHDRLPKRLYCTILPVKNQHQEGPLCPKKEKMAGINAK